MLQYWMLKAGFLDVYDAWEDPENSVWGVGCPESFILVFFTEGSADLASLSEQLDPRGPTSFRGCQ